MQIEKVVAPPKICFIIHYFKYFQVVNTLTSFWHSLFVGSVLTDIPKKTVDIFQVIFLYILAITFSMLFCVCIGVNSFAILSFAPMLKQQLSCVTSIKDNWQYMIP